MLRVRLSNSNKCKDGNPFCLIDPTGCAKMNGDDFRHHGYMGEMKKEPGNKHKWAASITTEKIFLNH